MKNYNVFILSLVLLFIGFVAGAKLTHPVYFRNYIPTDKQMVDCINAGGDYSLKKDKISLTYLELCEVVDTKQVFTHVLNEDIFDSTK